MATTTTGTAALIPGTLGNTVSTTATAYSNVDGLDLIWMQSSLQSQMTSVQSDIANIESNANLSDTEKMFSMQMAMNTWASISSLRTNILKSVADTLKSITRNIN